MYTRYCLFITCLALVSRAIAQSDGDRVILHRVSNKAVYSVPATFFPNKVKWQPVAEPFPLALGEKFTSAREYITESKHLTNNLRFFLIRIRAPASLSY